MKIIVNIGKWAEKMNNFIFADKCIQSKNFFANHMHNIMVQILDYKTYVLFIMLFNLQVVRIIAIYKLCIWLLSCFSFSDAGANRYASLREKE